MKRLIAAVVLGAGLHGHGLATIDTHEFADDGQRQRYRDLAAVLRCPKCQNQNIAESNSPIANDLRGEIHRMLGEGRSDDQIIDFMVSRYGDFVLYDPPLATRTALLWFGPVALLLAGGTALAAIVARRRRASAAAAPPLSEAERRRLASLLNPSSSPPGQDP